jgi:hypothetical protein
MKPKYTIRYRVIRGRKDYEKPASGEYQVLDGRRIVGRHDYEHQAQRQVARLCADDAAKVKP